MVQDREDRDRGPDAVWDAARDKAGDVGKDKDKVAWAGPWRQGQGGNAYVRVAAIRRPIPPDSPAMA